MDTPHSDRAAKLIALYFPQLHAIPENDRWWGQGFTDWDKVKTAQPLYPEYHQPRVPDQAHYYNQADLAVIRQQAALAKSYGIYGFCHYHYWFAGKQLLQTPTELLLANKDIDIRFCLSWANETWSRRWDGKDHQILIKQTHPPEKKLWKQHFDYLIRAWTDERAITIHGKPVFVIYRPHLIECINEMLDYWDTLVRAEGLPGLYIIYQQQYTCPAPDALARFDGVFEFQPFSAINRPQETGAASQRQRLRRWISKLPAPLQSLIWTSWSELLKSTTVYDYDTVWQDIVQLNKHPDLDTFHGAFVDWDNTARYGKRATIVKGATPEKFRHWFHRLITQIDADPHAEKIVFINAWNEWSECAYLEPDTVHGLAYLEAIRDVLATQA